MSDDTIASASNLFSPDRPIHSRREDLLGRTDFAIALANAIRRWKNREGLVLSISGPWGGGKSSVKNMILEELSSSPAMRPVVLEFDPWQWDGRNRLASAFYREIGTAIAQADTSDKGKQRSAWWNSYANYLASVSPTWVQSDGSGDESSESGWWDGLRNQLKTAQKSGTSKPQQPEMNLTDIKGALAESLKEMKSPLLVVIDDIDRLTGPEARLIFHLVQANADLPNLIYLLLFDRHMLIKCLEQTSSTALSEKFLDKIIQAQFDLPQINATTIDQVLRSNLGPLLEPEAVAKRFDERRWLNLYQTCLRPYFATLRDVRRFSSALSIQFSLFGRDATEFEVNPVDLIALEVLRQFENEVYRMLPSFKELLTQGLSSELKAEDAMRLADPLFEKANYRQNVESILMGLFPLLENGTELGAPQEWLRTLRVCHADLFDPYFAFSIPQDKLRQADIDQIIASAGKREVVVEKLREIDKRGLLATALERVHANAKNVSKLDSTSFITALFDIGDIMPQKGVGVLEIEAYWIVSWIVSECLHKLPSDERFYTLKKALETSTGLFMPVAEIFLESLPEERLKHPEDFILEERYLKEVQGIGVKKIKSAAKSGQLLENKRMLYLLFRWQQWAGYDEPSLWVENTIKEDKPLLQLLENCRVEQRASDDHNQITESLDLQSLKLFVSMESLRSRVNRLNVATLTPEQRKLVEMFKRQESK